MVLTAQIIFLKIVTYSVKLLLYYIKYAIPSFNKPTTIFVSIKSMTVVGLFLAISQIGQISFMVMCLWVFCEVICLPFREIIYTK